jgi:tetratricopeptide (TPR) repeat protein
MSKPRSPGRTARNAPRRVGPKSGEGQNRDLWIYLLLAGAIFAAYSQALHSEFVTYDDPDYVTANPHVRAGLSWAGAAWAFTSSFAGNWFPLTWLSHMLDYQIYGPSSGWHHFTNLWIHALTTILWFVLLQRMTGARWRSAFVAFLFGLHPLHVESVAWVAERKDVLSALFWVLALWGYAAYVEHPGRVRYLVALGLYCLGLMAKPMLVTLPVVLLLLDIWPLRRGPKILEKIPFFAAAAAVSVVTWFVHASVGATASLQVIPPLARVENSLVSYAIYILDMIWPAGLAVFYPFPTGPLLIPAIFAAAALVAATVFAIRALSDRPYLTIGWVWYVITLLPVIGLIQVGAQARADRYTYLPMIGISIALVWGASEALERWPRVRSTAATGFCAACVVLTWVQVGYWRDSVSLYRHAIAVVSENYVAHYNLASVLAARGESAEALAELREAVHDRPLFAPAHAELGQLLAIQGQSDEALRELRTAVNLRPDLPEPHIRLGSVLGVLGHSIEAEAELAEGIRLQPASAEAHYDLGITLAQDGKLQDAEREFRAAARLKPADVEARYNLGITLARLGRHDEAIDQFSEAVRIRPDLKEAREALDDTVRLKDAHKQ